MSISISCECGKKLRVKDELAGKHVKCPGCGKSILIPADDEPEDSEEPQEATPEKAVPAGDKAKDKKNAWLFALVAAGILVIGALGGYFIFLREDSSGVKPGAKENSPMTKQDPMITAEPNPVPAGSGKGTTTISWDTGDKTLGEVYVSVNGGEEKRFAGPRQKGSQEANWIGRGEFEFRLYAGKERTKLLGQVKVTRLKN